jgi:baculoviral IAP repeat-containing protein 6
MANYNNLSRCSKISISYAKLESAMIKFLSKCCWCHPANQELLAEFLKEVIISQKPSASKYQFLSR